MSLRDYLVIKIETAKVHPSVAIRYRRMLLSLGEIYGDKNGGKRIGKVASRSAKQGKLVDVVVETNEW